MYKAINLRTDPKCQKLLFLQCTERHIGEIMSKDVTKHCSTKTRTKGSQGLFILIFNSLILDCPQSFQIC